jgi:hypothetical protein
MVYRFLKHVFRFNTVVVVCAVISKKKGESESLVGCQYFYGRFLSINTASRAPITTIATIVIIDIGRKYRSAIEAGAGVGEEVTAGGEAKVI